MSDQGDDSSLSKRKQEDSSSEPSSKRFHSEEVAVKVLFSNKEAGTVIGRKGATIANIQERSAAVVRVSHSGDYFPGTEDRIVLVKGTVSTVRAALDMIFTELYSESETWKQISSSQGVNSSDAVLSSSIVIPEGAAGPLIGKGGENIRIITESSNAKVQLVPKEKQTAPVPERIVTIQGTLPQIIKASSLIVERMAGDPKCVFQNLTTQYDSGNGFGAPPSGRGFGDKGRGDSYRDSPSLRDGPPSYRDSAGYGYGDRGGGYGGPYGGSGPYGGPGPYGGGSYGGPYGGPPPYGGAGSYGGPGAYGAGPYSAPGYGASGSYGGGPYPYAAPHSYGGPGGPGPGQASFTLHVPEQIVAAILGKGGDVIKELMRQTGASIKVSKKGEVVPGTDLRIVTITGRTPCSGSPSRWQPQALLWAWAAKVAGPGLVAHLWLHQVTFPGLVRPLSSLLLYPAWRREWR
eukprot:CAMPEP_0113663326 /NCGR_PEP_ID=MMETSP0038_2-20120614/1077_1 /TAXON_ID=2898 /ORGANISM="Cryptomonas paramecium" /LENGTH=460 /DNA_ID=CAMNT_0000578335 /DNA_START=14 /DNA_END=1392 /DNA_ORIENTATION=- /assembly_acc=CAM_ASM_000170